MARVAAMPYLALNRALAHARDRRGRLGRDRSSLPRTSRPLGRTDLAMRVEEALDMTRRDRDDCVGCWSRCSRPWADGIPGASAF